MSTDWEADLRRRLPEHLDAAGDLAPPWEQFPTYTRRTIGWRMGAGEEWMMLWGVFLGDLGPAVDVRLAYLQRHPPAPITWADRVFAILHPDAGSRPAEAELAERRAALSDLGLVASDAAYPAWRSQQSGVHWPWEWSATPTTAARYQTRELAFWSRQIAELRRDPTWAPPTIPAAWQACEEPLRTGDVRDPDVRQGLLTLARMLAAGRVAPPWELGLALADFANTFDDGMGYVDAFRCWVMCSFDDREHLERYLASTADPPPEWRPWFEERFRLN